MLQKKIQGNWLLSSGELCAQRRALTVRPELRKAGRDSDAEGSIYRTNRRSIYARRSFSPLSPSERTYLLRRVTPTLCSARTIFGGGLHRRVF